MTMEYSDEITEKALKKCWNILDSLEIGNRIIVSDFAPKNPELFLSCCKKYYDCFRNLRFSDDYSEIQKIKRDLTFKEQLF